MAVFRIAVFQVSNVCLDALRLEANQLRLMLEFTQTHELSQYTSVFPTGFS